MNKYQKICNFLNGITFCLVSNKSKNIILSIFFNFSLSHLFFICISFSKSLFKRHTLIVDKGRLSHQRESYELLFSFCLFFIVNLFKCFYPHFPLSCYVFFSSFDQIWRGHVTLSCHGCRHHDDPVALGVVSLPWRCLSFIVSSRCY